MPKRSLPQLADMLAEFGMVDAMHGVPFKPRAYELAAETVTSMGHEVEDAWQKGGVKELKKLPGIGQAIAEKIDEYFRTGRMKEYTALKKKFPVDIVGLTRIEGMGPQTIKQMYDALRIKSVTDLKRAIAKKKLQTLERFGPAKEARIARALGMMEKASGRRLLADALPIADRIVEALKKVPGVKRCSYAGSLRRRQETIGDVDLIATLGVKDSTRIMDAFTHLPDVERVHEQGKTRASVRLRNGMDADLRVVADNVYGATLQYFTGDKRHNVLLREYAISKGYTLNEYGLFKKDKKTPVACKTEEDVYRALNMDTPPPELRVGGDELDAAKKHRLPTLIPYGSVKGDLQVQTEWTDGAASINDMAKAAKDADLSYMAITDHTKALGFIHGLDDKQVLKQKKEIATLNKSLRSFRILAGTECDIRRDGSLDLKDDTLKQLDWVGISVHSAFRLSRKDQTTRVVKAMQNPHVHCLFHPTARRIGKREPIDLDMDEIITAAKKYRVALEIDAAPERQDLNDLHVRAAIRAGVTLVIDTDAHAPDQFNWMPLGEAIARRGWARKADILNTKDAKSVLAWAKKKS